jgi:excisionase family DNA binding protein
MKNFITLEENPRTGFADPDEPICSFEAAAFLGISHDYLYRLIRKKGFPCHKPTGKRLFFFRREIIDWVKTNNKHEGAEQ